MSDEAAFLAAIFAEPDDDTVRLVFADWLEERAGAVACPACSGAGLRLANVGPDGRWVPCPTCRGAEFVPDTRAEGYRSLARLRRKPHFRGATLHNYPHNYLYGRTDNGIHHCRDTLLCLLPPDWFEAVAPLARSSWDWWAEWSARRAAEDAAALAFAKLPAARRAELLAAAGAPA